MIDIQEAINNIHENVKWYARKNNKQIGEIEKELNLSVGFFSRMYLHRACKFTALVKLANYMGLSLDDITGKLWLWQQYNEQKDKLSEIEKKLGVNERR